MRSATEQQADGRRQRKERRKSRFLPYIGKEQRKVEIVREADVFEIYLPPMKSTPERRGVSLRREKPR